MRLEFLRSLYEGKGDYASVYLDASRAGATASEEISLRWRAARQTLADAVRTRRPWTRWPAS